MSKPKIMVISASSGSGHTQAANAVIEAAKSHAGVGEVLDVDALAYTNKLFRDFYAKMYVEVVKNTPALWEWWYEKSDEPWKTDNTRLMFELPNMKPFCDHLKEQQPDITICTHFLASEIVSHLLSKNELTTRLAIVVTDFHVHAMWLSRNFDRYFVPAMEAKEELSVIGIPPERITVSGIPVRACFSVKKDINALKRKHGLEVARPIILISAGTFGVTSAEDIVRALQRLTAPAQIVVVCGKDAELKQEVERFTSKHGHEHLAYHVVGYTHEMDEWMAVADLFIGKPGGLTTAESLASGLPMVIFHPIPGQEQHNSDYLLENGVAVKPNGITTMAFKVDQLLGDPVRLKTMREKALALGHPHAAQEVVDVMVGGTKKEQV